MITYIVFYTDPILGYFSTMIDADDISQALTIFENKHGNKVIHGIMGMM